jgi:ankyrin repeat protein
MRARVDWARIALSIVLLPVLSRDVLGLAQLQASHRDVPLLRVKGGGAVMPCLPLSSEEVVHSRLIRAAKMGHIEQMHRLVRQGAHVNTSNERGQSPLIKAAERGHTEAVVVLLKLGADIGFLDWHLSTALHYAAYHGHTRTVNALAALAPEQINRKNKFGYTPLSYASADGHTSTISALVKLGANVDHLDNMGLGPLHRAAAGGHVQAVKALVQAGATINGVRKKGFGADDLPRREVHNTTPMQKSFWITTM